MTLTARVLVVLIVLAALAGVATFVVRYQAFGPEAAVGTPIPSGHPAAEGWSPIGEAPFARLEMATAVLGGRFWLAGGLTPDGGVEDALSVFDPVSREWSEAASLPEPVHHAALASDGEKLLLVGGYLGATGQPTDAVRVYDPATDAWSDGPSMPEPRAAGALAFDGERFVYGGGVGPGGVRDEVFAFRDGAWTELGVMTRGREHLAAASDGKGRVWLMGGRQGGLDRNVGDVELIHGAAIELVASVTPRGGVAAFHTDDLGACLTGGEAPAFAFTRVECVDADGQIAALPELSQRRHGHGAGVIDGVAYALLGGEIQGLNATATVEALAVGE